MKVKFLFLFTLTVLFTISSFALEDGHKMLFTKGKENSVKLILTVDGTKTVETVTMMPGYTFEVKDSDVFWKESSIKVGNIESGKIHVCEGTFKESCSLHVERQGNAKNAPFVGTIKTGDSSNKMIHKMEVVAPLPTSFNELIQYVIPVPNQFDAGSCAFMSSTVLMEILANKSEGIVNPEPDSKYDLSERFTMNYEYYYNTPSVKKFMRDLPLTFNDAEGSVKSNVLPFTMSKYSTSTSLNWNNAITKSILSQKMPLPKLKQYSIFYDSRIDTRGYHTNGRFTQDTLIEMKKKLVEYKSPIWYIYYPTGQSWWHAITIIGYDDAKANFIAIDSSFGNETKYKYYYGRTTAGAKGYPRLKDTVKYISYSSVLKYGMAATLYYLDTPATEVKAANNCSCK